MTAWGIPMKPFRIIYTISVNVENLERHPDETEDEARKTIRRDIEAGLKLTTYDLPWDVIDSEIEEVEHV